MTMQIYTLDDQRFDDLVREALLQLPSRAPEWTNHNPSDPGITLVELLAYFTDILVYRIGRIPSASKLQFLRLLKGEKWPELDNFANAEDQEIICAINDAVRELSQIDCAVTADDFVQHAKRAAISHSGKDQPFRVLCLSGVDLENRQRGLDSKDSRAQVSVTIIPGHDMDERRIALLCDDVRRELQPRCLLGTQLHVVGPMYLHVALGVRLVAMPGDAARNLLQRISEALHQHFGPADGQGLEGKGWPFGRPLHVSEIIETIDQITGVDYVVDVTVLQMSTRAGRSLGPETSVGIQIGVRSTIGQDTRLGGPSFIGTDRLVRSKYGKLVSVMLRQWELLDLNLVEDQFVIANTAGTGRLQESGGPNG
jgi:hypothetical protein